METNVITSCAVLVCYGNSYECVWLGNEYQWYGNAHVKNDRTEPTCFHVLCYWTIVSSPLQPLIYEQNVAV